MGAFVCPRCHGALEDATDPARRQCPVDNLEFVRRDGIWRFLLPEDRERAAPFLHQYRTVRDAEAWGRDDDAYYRDLPQVAADDPHRAIWHIRAITYRVLRRRILTTNVPQRIVDLGAGNGWLAHRLSHAGHQVAAVDLDDDARDGLGTWPRYTDSVEAPPPFLPVQATFDQLPWPDDTFDVALFNGALHYSADYAATLAEACRVVRPGGTVAILDSPFYRHVASGRTMVAERAAGFRARHGAGCGTVVNEGFLTLERLHTLGAALRLNWRVARPFYGLRWALRPLQNRILRRREPTRFWVVWARVETTNPKTSAEEGRGT